MLNITILYLDDILFVFIDGCKEFSLDASEVFSYFMAVEVAGLFLEDEI